MFPRKTEDLKILAQYDIAVSVIIDVGPGPSLKFCFCNVKLKKLCTWGKLHFITRVFHCRDNKVFVVHRPNQTATEN